MRTSEVQALAVGCRTPVTEVPEGLVRHRVVGKLIKGQPLGGTVDEWVVTEEVHRAIAIAEAIRPDTKDGDLLFGRFAIESVYPKFRGWVNGPAGERLGLAPIPAGAVNLQMLRRTLAVELAYRPGGLLAAKIALKHVSVVTTEGYASRPGGAQAKFLAEVGVEEQQRNLELVLTEYHNYRNGIRPSGPGATDMVGFFAGVDSDLAELTTTVPKTVPGDQEIRTLLNKRAETLHLGVANYCWFVDPTKALCLKLAGTPNADKPLAGLCDSARCPQATHHACHRPVWAATVKNNTVFLGTLSRGQNAERTRLQTELARAERILAEIDKAGRPEALAPGTDD